MNRFKHIEIILTVSVSLIFLISCNQNNEELVYDPELVFVNSLKIRVEPYSYFNSDSTAIYKILGDSAVVADTVDSLPVFIWQNVWPNIATVVVSKEFFTVNNNTISNADQIIWQWQPGMEEGEYGMVAFPEGKPVENENILYDTQPLPLESGLYYWAVWAWDNGGRNIIYSSKPQKLYVK